MPATGGHRVAYSYWESASTSSLRASYAHFARGYVDTASVALFTGTTFGEGAVGRSYVSVPTVLVATHTSRSMQRCSSCYLLQRRNPRIRDTNPESRFWHISRGQMRVAPAGTTIATLLACGCRP